MKIIRLLAVGARIVAIATMALSVLSAQAHVSRISEENQQLLRELDEMLSYYDSYEMQRVQKIDHLKKQMSASSNAEERFWIVKNIFDEYKIFDGDSALKYADMTLALAGRLNRPDLDNNLRITTSYTLAAIGLLDQSLKELQQVNVSTLDSIAHVDYLGQKVYLLTHQEQFASPNSVGMHTPQAILDSISAILPANHPEYLYWTAYPAIATPERAQAALATVVPAMADHRYDTPEDAKLAWIISCLYERVGDDDNKMKYLILSAMADLRIGNREIASLEELSAMMDRYGELQRAYNYIGHCLRCAEQYKNRVRALKIASMQSFITKRYQDRLLELQQQSHYYNIALVILVIVLLAVIFYVYLQRRALANSNSKLNGANQEAARRLTELTHTYSQLAEKNDSLLTLSGELSAANEKLAESHAVTVKCVGSIMGVCSQNIDKYDQFKHAIYRLLRDKQYDEARKMVHDPESSQQEIDEFYRTFDEIFLSIYPDFVEKFNTLLHPDEQIAPRSKEGLNTALRIYALVSLGITDSVTIANILHCSVGNIYNTRMKVRNKAIVPKEEFVEYVQRVVKIN